MSKKTIHTSEEEVQDIVIQIPKRVRKNLPEDFNIGDIGKINLHEAETIANEDILLLDENDLIEGLEEFDLIPLKEKKEDRAPIEQPNAETRVVPEKTEESKEGQRDSHFLLVQDIQTGHEEKPRRAEIIISEPVTLEEQPKAADPYYDRKNWVPLEDVYNESKEDIRVPLQEFHGEKKLEAQKPHEEIFEKIPEAVETTRPEKEQIVEEKKEEQEPSSAQDRNEPSVDTPVNEKGDVQSTDEYMYSEKSEEPIEGKEPGKKEVMADIETTHEKAAAFDEKATIDQPEVKEVESQADDAELTSEVEKTDTADFDYIELVSLEDECADQSSVPATETIAEHDIAPKTEGEETRVQSPVPDQPEIKTSFEKELILEHPQEKNVEEPVKQWERQFFADIATPDFIPEKVMFINDTPDTDIEQTRDIFDESDLDKIIADMVQVDEGASYILKEAKVDDDRERIAVIIEAFKPDYDAFLFDREYKYIDDELDYIHTAIVREDYSNYISEIDEYFRARGGRTVSTAVELLGLTADEFDTIEDQLFQDEFKDVHLYNRYHLYEFDRTGHEKVQPDLMNFRYLLASEKSLLNDERDSIESDVTAKSALIFEEDVDIIKDKLKKRTGKTINLEDVVPVPQKQEVAIQDKPSFPTNIYDITDRVVILDDQADVDRFIKEFPERRQVDIKTLLKFLDGLFERLPEEIIKKFASSEYFDLYLKVLNELGV